MVRDAFALHGVTPCVCRRAVLTEPKKFIYVADAGRWITGGHLWRNDGFQCLLASGGVLGKGVVIPSVLNFVSHAQHIARQMDVRV
jgi:hypothetical protein